MNLWSFTSNKSTFFQIIWYSTNYKTLLWNKTKYSKALQICSSFHGLNCSGLFYLLTFMSCTLQQRSFSNETLSQYTTSTLNLYPFQYYVNVEKKRNHHWFALEILPSVNSVTWERRVLKVLIFTNIYWRALIYAMRSSFTYMLRTSALVTEDIYFNVFEEKYYFMFHTCHD